MKNIKVGQLYTFKDMESFLDDWENRSKVLVIEDKCKDRGMMHTFGGNFCGDWLSGDGVVFWNNKDVTSAEPNDEFNLLKIILF